MRYLRSLLGFLGRTLETCLRAWGSLLGSLPLWFRAWFSVQTRVCKDLNDRATEAEEFIAAGGHAWLDSEVLIWDYEVRSILRRHLGPDHLTRYERATALSLADEADPNASTDALRHALFEIRANIQAVQRKTIRPSGGWSDAWWLRTAEATLITASVGIIVGLVVSISGVTAGSGPSKLETSNPTSGTTQSIVEDHGEVVVAISPIPTSTPAETPLAVSEEPVIDIPAKPEEDQPTDEAAAHFEAGVAALEDEDFLAAVTAFKDAIEAEPGFVRAYYNLAVAYDNIGTEEANQAAVKNYTAAIELWNSLESDGDGLLFEAKLGRGLLLVRFFTDEQAICLGRSDLLEYLERGDVSQRNAEAVNKALAGIEVDCEKLIEIP